MRFLILTLLGLASAIFSTAAFGQDLLPELAPTAKAHQTDSAALMQQKTAELETVKKVYLGALDEADRAATTAGNVNAVKAVAKERETLEKGDLAASAPSDIPKTLAAARKTFMHSSERVHADFDARQKALDASYLRFLGSLQLKAASSAKLGAQIIAEKQKLLMGVYGPISDLRTEIDGTSWKDTGKWTKSGASVTFKKGKLSQLSRDGTKTNGPWTYETPTANQVMVVWGGDTKVVFTLAKDGKTLLEGGQPRFELVVLDHGK